MNDAESNSDSYEDRTQQTLADICNWSHPQREAIQYHDLENITCIKYKELHAQKERIFAILEKIDGHEFIGINSDFPIYCIPALILGIISSGHSFVNLPKDSESCENLINLLDIQYVFVRDSTPERLVLNAFAVHNVHVFLTKKERKLKMNKEQGRKYTYAYAISTSGSTGVPKVVRVPHSSIVPNILDLRRILKVTKSDIIAQFTNITFDPSIIEIFLAFVSTGTLFMVSDALKVKKQILLQKMYSNEVSILQMTPSLFLYGWFDCSQLTSTILSNDTALRVILFGGEPFPKIQLISKMKHPQNKTRIYNIYGITEVSCWSSINEVNTCVQSNTQFLGDVLSDTVFQVRNDAGELVTTGTGVLYIGSDTRVCVINDENIEELKPPVFRDSGDIVEIDEQGSIFYKGRKNCIVKRYGTKIDLTVLEKAVLQLNFVKTCYAVWDEEHHKLHLCLSTFNVPGPQYPHMKIMLTKCLHTLDPLYRPDKVHFLDNSSIAFTSTGKICMEFLRRKYAEDKIIDSKVVRIDVEMCEIIFKDIWTDNLKDENVGFVKLGGTSVIALQISNAISEASNMEFPELIGMLLKDATFNTCIFYLKKTLMNNVKSEIAEHLEYDYNRPGSSTDVIVEDKAMPTNPPNIKLTSLCRWYKCRGRRYGNAPMKNLACGPKLISNIQILHMWDLRKCVDASPTIFQCSEGKSYATVGSHSGIVCTFELGEENIVPFELKFPNRIEACVLILDDLKGVVGCYDGCVYCFYLKIDKIVWKYETEDIVKCTPITCDKQEKVFFGSYDCYAYCVSAMNGSEIWKVKASNGAITASGCLHIQTDSVLFGTLDGTCLAIHQSSGKVMWKHRLKDPIFVAPVTLNCGLVLFCSVAGSLCCFDIEINIEMWKIAIYGNVFSYIVTRDDPITKCQSIILAGHNKNVYCLASSDGMDFKRKPILNRLHTFQSPIFATPWCEGNVLFVACTNGSLNVYSLSENKLLRTIKLPGDVFSSPVVHNDLVIVGCRDNNVYFLKFEC